MVEESAAPISTEKRLDVVVAELHRAYDRIETMNDSGTTVAQYVLVIFGAVLVVAEKQHWAVVALPIFWSVWLLYVQMVDFNTLKFALVARRLETEANRIVGQTVFAWENVMASREAKKPIIYYVNYVYWALLNFGSYLVAGYIVYNFYGIGWSILLFVSGLVVSGLSIFNTVVRRPLYVESYNRLLDEAGM